MTEWPPQPIEAPRRRHKGRVVLVVRRTGKLVLALVSVVVLTLTWYGWQFVGNVNEGLATTDVFGGPPPAKPLDGAIDILLVGQDSRTDAQGNPLPREVLDMLHAGDADGERQTDTMILVHIPQNGQRAVAISFPRDSYVTINGGFGKHKLNSAYVYAYNDKSKTLQQQGIGNSEQIDEQAKVAGRKNLITTLEQFIGKPGIIDRYAEVNLSSFYEVTKSIGGVEVCLKDAVREPKSGVNLPKGTQSVQGVQALAFVRQRYGLPNGDLDRIARQQAFLSGLASKVLSTSVLTSPTKISDLVGAVKKSVVLSQGWDLLEFAEQMRGLTGGNIQFRTIPTEGNAVIGGADVVRVDQEKVQTFVNGLVSDGTPAPAPGQTPGPGTSGTALPGADAVTVDLFDGSGKAKLGGETRNLLRSKGFQIGQNSELSTRTSTVVRYPPGSAASLALIKQVFGTSVQAEPDSDVAAGHVRVLLGRDYNGAAAAPAAGSGTATPAATPTPTPAPTSTTSSVAPGGSSAAPEPGNGEAITAAGVPCVN